MAPTYIAQVPLCPLWAAMAGVLLTACSDIAPENPDPTTRPNIIYIMADDLGYADLGVYGQERVATPHIDRLAAEGMRFTDHYSGHTVCRPSRLVLWTGLHSGHTPISANLPYVFRPEDLTVAELLKEAGYTTGGVGKWTMGDTSNTGHPNENGFDFWMGYLDQGEAHNYYPTHLWRNREMVPLLGNVLNDDPEARGLVAAERGTYAHDVITNEALSFIRRSAEGPFLLHVHWTIPHANNESGGFTGDGMEVPDYGIYADQPWPDQEKGFAAMITRMDRDVGRLTELLDELGIADHTVVFFTSDNGPHKEGGHDSDFFDSNGQLRGIKRDLYEGGIRVPLIARWPGTIEAGSTSAFPSAFWDYLPTAAEIAGIKPPEGLDGVSYLPTLLGRTQPPREYLFWEFAHGDLLKLALRKDAWKAVRPDSAAAIELYDLSEDIGEANDLAADFPDVVAEMERLMADALRPAP